MTLIYGKKEIPVLFENDACLVLDKPAGLSVQGGEGVKVSLDSILSAAVAPRPFLVHRLDRDTSGLLLVAKTKEAAGRFSAIMSGRINDKSGSGVSGTGKGVIKRYLGVCSGGGQNAAKEGVMRLSLDIRGKAKEAETFYRLLSSAEYAEPGNGVLFFSLLELELGTGRMHQIRRHLALNNNPLLGDDKYGDFTLNKKLKKTCAVKHLLLHASRLVIPPVKRLLESGLDVTAPLPGYFSFPQKS